MGLICGYYSLQQFYYFIHPCTGAEVWNTVCAGDRYLMLDGASPIVYIIAISQHIHHLSVPAQLYGMLLLGLTHNCSVNQVFHTAQHLYGNSK